MLIPPVAMRDHNSIRAFIHCKTADRIERDFFVIPAVNKETIAQLLIKVRARARIIPAQVQDLEVLYLYTDAAEQPVRLNSDDTCGSVLHDEDHLLATVAYRRQPERTHLFDEVPNALKAAPLHTSTRHRRPYAQHHRNAVPSVSRVQSWERCDSRYQSQCTSAYTSWHPFPSESPDTEEPKRHSRNSHRKYASARRTSSRSRSHRSRRPPQTVKSESRRTSRERSNVDAVTPIVWIQTQNNGDKAGQVLCLLYEGKVPQLCSNAHSIMQYVCECEKIDVRSSWNTSEKNENTLRHALLARIDMFKRCDKDKSKCPFFTVATSNEGYIALGCGGPNVKKRAQMAKLAMAIVFAYYGNARTTAAGSDWFPAEFTQLVDLAFKTSRAFEQKIEDENTRRTSF